MTELLAAAFVLIAVAAAAQAVTGFGFVLVAVPFVALLTDPRTSVVTCTTLGLMVTAWGWYHERTHVEWRSVGAIVAGAVLGIPLGMVVFTSVAMSTLQLIIGAVVLTFAGLLLLRVRVPGGRPTNLIAGTVSGGMLATTGMTGPPVVLALQAAHLSPRPFRASLQAALTLQSMVVVTGLGVSQQFSFTSLAVVAVGAPALLLGWRAGDRLFHRLPASRIRYLILWTLVLSGAATIGHVLLSNRAA